MSAHKITSYVSTQSLPAEAAFQAAHSSRQAYVYSPELYDRGPKGDPKAKHRSYQNLESGQGEGHYPFAIDDLDEMAGDLENLEEGFPIGSTGISEKAPEADATSAAELKAATTKLRQNLDRLKTQVQKSSLSAESKAVLLQQADDLYRQLKDPKINLDSLSEEFESLREAFEEESAEADEKAMNLEMEFQHFKSEIEVVKMELKAKIDAVEKLDATTKANLVIRYQEKADALLKEKDLKAASGKLDTLSRYLELDIQAEIKAAEAKARAEDVGGDVVGGY